VSPRAFWRLIGNNLFTTLGLLLGAMQVVVGHWVTVVVAGRPGPGLAPGLALAAALVAANAAAIPAMRRARRAGGWPRRIASAYLSAGLVTLLVGLAISLSWLGFLPLAGIGRLAGASGETLFTLFRAASGAVVAVLLWMLAWGFTLGRARLDRTHLRVELRGLDEALRGLRIVQISDLHIGNVLAGEPISTLVAHVNALEADLVVVTGDLFDFDPRFVEDGARRLGDLRARSGVYVVLGNHDVYTGTELVVRALAEHAPGLRLLRDERVRLPLAAPLYLAGVEDPGRDWTARALELPALEALGGAHPEDGPTVLLVHRPEAFRQAARLGFPLVLAGHTHGGQIALPTRRGRLNPARFITHFVRGVYHENGSVLYVNRGAGFAGPALRFNCPREIATIELV
jgi:predicted MPP superfamily phosphohydrolase